MAATNVIISDSRNPAYDGNLSTANAWYQVEAGNLGAWSTTGLAISTTRTQEFTFSNACNCLGVGISLYGSAGTVDRDATVYLQETKTPTAVDTTAETLTITAHGYADQQPIAFSGTVANLTAGTIYYVKLIGDVDKIQVSTTAGGSAVNLTSTTLTSAKAWYALAYQTLTAAQITASTDKIAAGYDVPFTWSGVAVDTTASKYRIQVTQTGGSTSGWNLRTSDATNPFYFVWGDNQVTFSNADNNKCPIIMDDIIVDDTVTCKAQRLPTGDTARAMAGLIMRNTTIAPNTVSSLLWEFPAAAAYTLSIDGLFIIGANAGFSIGRIMSITGTLAAGATSATLSAVWPFATGSYQIQFIQTGGKKWDYKVVTLTNGSASVSWTGGLNYAAYAYIGVANTSTYPADIYYVQSPTYGTIYSGFNDWSRTATDVTSAPVSSQVGRKAHLYLMGDIPAVPCAELAYNALFGGTATMSIADPCVVTKTAHLMTSGQVFPVQFSTTGALPTGVTAGTVYWTRYVSADTFHLYDTYAHAADTGSTTGRVVTSGTQSGTHTANTVIYTTSATGWVNGDKFYIGKANVSGQSDTLNEYTVSSTSGTLVTATTNLATVNRIGVKNGSATDFWGASIMRSSGYGITFRNSTTSPVYGLSIGCPTNTIIRGAKFTDCRNSLTYGTSFYAQDDSTNLLPHYIGYTFSIFSTNGYFCFTNATNSPKGITVENNLSVRCNIFSVIYRNSTATAGILFDGNHSTAGSNSTISGDSSTQHTFSENRIQNCNTAFIIAGIKSTYTNNYVWGASSAAFYFRLSASGTFNGNRIDKSNIGISFDAYTSVNNISTDDILGVEAANTSDIYFVADCFPVNYQANSPTGNLVVNTTYLSSITDGGQVLIKDFNDSVGDYRSWTRGGTFVSTSGKIRATNTDASISCYNAYKIQTQSVTGFPIFFGVNLQRSSTSDTEAPNIYTYYDAGTTSTPVVSANNTDLQSISTTITPTTDTNDIMVYLSQITATYCDWDTLEVFCKTYGYTFQENTIVIDHQINDPVALITTPVSNPYITVSNKTTVGAYSEFTIDHSAGTCTITADTTEAKLYDYSQYDLASDGGANTQYPEWFTTLDGVNYTSTYDIILNNGVDLTGGGSITLGSGNTFTKTGTATYDGIIIYDDASREVHLQLNGLVANSTVQIYDNDNTTEIYNDTVTGTSLNYIYTWTVDTELRIRVRKAGYIPYEYTGDIVNTGLSLNISQEADDVYTGNGIDGSTVTEFSFSGGTIKVYVDDPDNTTTGQRMYNWYMYNISSETYIGLQPYDIIAQTSWSYTLADEIQLYNSDAANPCFIEGANLNNVTGDGQVIDTAGGMININGYFPFSTVADVGKAVKDAGVLTTAKFLGLK